MHAAPLLALLASFLHTTSASPIYYPPSQYPLDTPDVSPALQSKLELAFKGPLYDYPTSFTQGIIPVRASGLCLPVIKVLILMNLALAIRKASIHTMTIGDQFRSIPPFPSEQYPRKRMSG